MPGRNEIVLMLVLRTKALLKMANCGKGGGAGLAKEEEEEDEGNKKENKEGGKGRQLALFTCHSHGTCRIHKPSYTVSPLSYTLD